MEKSLDQLLFELYVDYACRALLGGGKGKFVMDKLRIEDPDFYYLVMKRAKEVMSIEKEK